MAFLQWWRAPRLALRFSSVCLLAAVCRAAAAAASGDAIFADGFDFGAPGPGPTQICSPNPDADGFFVLNSGASTYTIRLPPGYDVQNPQPKALLVAMHGCGDTALNFAQWAVVPSALRSTQTYIAVSLGGRDGNCFFTPADDALVTAAVAHVRSCFYVHQHRIVLGGYSSGGSLAYQLALSDASAYAGILIEKSSLSDAVGTANVDTVLNAAAWKINIGHSAGLNDTVFPIAGVRSDRDKILAHQFPLEYRETISDHTGDSADWSDYLIPLMTGWASP